MHTQTATITRRSRNLGIGWRNTPRQVYNHETGKSWLEIEEVTTPSVTGSYKQVLAEYRRAKRINSGGLEWRAAFFVGGRRIAPGSDLAFRLTLLEGKLSDEETVEVLS